MVFGFEIKCTIQCYRRRKLALLCDIKGQDGDLSFMNKNILLSFIKLEFIRRRETKYGMGGRKENGEEGRRVGKGERRKFPSAPIYTALLATN